MIKSRHQFGIAVERLQRILERRKTLLYMTIRGPQPFIARRAGDFQLAALHHHPRPRKCRLQRARRPPPHNPAAVIEVQMRQHDVRHVPRFHPERLKPVGEPALAVIENLALDRAQAIADSGVDQDSRWRRA